MADDNGAAPQETIVQFPLWTLYDESKDPTDGQRTVPPINFPGIGPTLAIFTTDVLARQFLLDSGGKGFGLLALPTPEAAIKIAEFFKERGTKDVAIDITAKPPRATAVAIGEFIDGLRAGRSIK